MYSRNDAGFYALCSRSAPSAIVWATYQYPQVQAVEIDPWTNLTDGLQMAHSSLTRRPKWLLPISILWLQKNGMTRHGVRVRIARMPPTRCGNNGKDDVRFVLPATKFSTRVVPLRYESYNEPSCSASMARKCCGIKTEKQTMRMKWHGKRGNHFFRRLNGDANTVNMSLVEQWL
ncbi:hypothetical protein PsorP6_007890 [Peronosclerospora sorghi]|uniref:Uncharacterized protein n=1 Tax=Peronosclerospora sorghi TaxID=230839 RepID=A0ACC0WC19_9STRA|nr:hypothetical protein PsorP6_007890 [Peronosclerospora sorghi]